ncbi:MAG: histidine kinase dimerization/phospho-acceptor domain-containing protein, partial [Dokdonella sp.]
MTATGTTSKRTQGGTVATADLSPREVRFFNLYRLFEAVIYAALVFSSLWQDWVGLRFPQLGQFTAVSYLVAALMLLGFTAPTREQSARWATFALIIDIVAASLLLIALNGGRSAIPIMLIVNLGGAALWLPLRRALALAVLAAIGVAAPAIVIPFIDGVAPTLGLENGLYTVVYLAITALGHLLGRQLRATEALAEQRGVDLLNLEQVNDLIIRRMKTGVLLVDEKNQILRINESAWHLVGTPPPTEHDLGKVSPELARRIYRWRTTGKSEQTAVALAEELPQVIPRFTRLAPNDESHALIFLDDTSLLSRRAEELTLTSLGRLSASIAHEIRNPLAAIRYSAQLLAESPDLGEEDKRLVEIVNNHTTRANDVIENILQLSRRERSRPENIDVNIWVKRFVDEYLESNDIGADQLVGMTQNRRVEAMADPQQLQQVVWNLVQNALRYGRQPNQPG